MASPDVTFRKLERAAATGGPEDAERLQQFLRRLKPSLRQVYEAEMSRLQALRGPGVNQKEWGDQFKKTLSAQEELHNSRTKERHKRWGWPVDEHVIKIADLITEDPDILAL